MIQSMGRRSGALLPAIDDAPIERGTLYGPLYFVLRSACIFVTNTFHPCESRAMAYVFGEHLLDVRKRQLWCCGKLLGVEPQVFDLLAYLVQHHDRVVGKEELLQTIWGGRIVSESAVTTRINAARRALGDDGERQRLIRTLPRKGLRFIAEVTEAPDGVGPSSGGVDMASRGLSLVMPDKPSIAVLPFTTIGGDPEQRSFADGAVEEIITALSRIRWLLVIARSSSFAYKGQFMDAKRLGRELGACYVLDGAVRGSGGRVRITAQLIDAETGAHLWADRFDGTLDEIFELQDRVAANIAGAIEPALEAVEVQRSAQRPTDDLTPHDLYLRAIPGLYSYDARSLLRAHDLLEQAIERDPGYGPALAAAAGCRQFLAPTGWADDPELNRLKAVELAHQALQADGNDPRVLTEAARVVAYFTQDIDAAISMIERALAFQPGYARGWYWNGWIRILAGRPDVAITHFQTAARLNPRQTHYRSSTGMAHFFGRRYREAADALIAAAHERPGWPTTLRFLAASYAQLGDLVKAREIANRLRAITPAFTSPPDCLGDSPFRNREQLTLYAEGLRLAAGAA